MTNPFGDEEHGSNPFGDEAVSGNPFGDQPEAPQTTLFSAEGVKAIGKSIAPTVERGMLGLKLFKQQNPDPIMSRPIAGVVNPLHAAATPEEIAQTQDQLRANQTEIDAVTPQNPSYPLKIATGATQSIAQNLPALVASVATKNAAPMIASAAAQTKGQSYAEDRMENPFGDAPVSQEDAVKNAGIKAGIEGALEAIPAIGLLKDVGKQSFGKTAGKFILREEATEIPTTIGQNISDQVYAHPDKPLGQFASDTLSDVIDTAITTPFAAGGTVAIASAQQKAQDKLAAVFQRKEADQAQTLDAYKQDLLAQLQQKAQEAAMGLSEPPAAPGMVRVYHSGSVGEGDSGRWVSTDKQYASNYRPDLPLYYLDLPANDPRINNIDYPDTQGIQQGFTFNFETTPQEAMLLQQTPREEDLMAQKMATQVNHQDVPDRPLTPEEEVLAKTQLSNMKSGANAIPVDPVAQADTSDFDSILSDPVYQQPADSMAKKEAMIQNDMDRGMSREVAERRALDEFPVTLPPSQRPIAWSTNSGHIGLNLQQAQIAPGDVVVIGGNDEQFSPAYTQALGQTIASWSRTIMPEGSRIVLNLSGLTGNAVGGYQQSASGIHVISPRELVRTARGEISTPEGTALGNDENQGYNTFTQQQTFGALTHEFGHALVMASFANRMPTPYRNVVGALDTGKTYSEQEIAQMPQEEGAVVREYQAMKQRVLDGSMNAEELVENWLGPWKVGKDLMKRQGRDLYSFAKAALLREAKITGNSSLSSTPLNLIPARTLIHAMGRNTNVTPAESDAAAENYYLQFNEYMAEQFSRYAHANKIDQGTPLGTYFKRALDSLRAFFKSLKTRNNVSGEAVIKPGVSFQEWVDKMGMAKAVRMAEAQKPKTSRKPAVRKPKKAADVEDLPRELAKKEEEKEKAAGEGNAVDEGEELAEDPQVKEDLKARIRQILPDPTDRDRAELMRLVARGQLVDAEDQLADIAAERTGVKRDIDPEESEVEAALKRVGAKDTPLWTRAVSFARRAQHAILQLQQLSYGSDDTGLATFVINQNKLMAMKNNMLKAGSEIAQRWEKLSRADTEKMEKVLTDEFHSGGHASQLTQDPVTMKWSHTAGVGFIDYLKQRGIDATTPEGEALGKLILDIKNSILEHIQIVEDMAIQHVKYRYRKAPLMIQKRSYEIREAARKWRVVPFVPQGHYGNYVVKVFEKDEDGKRQLAYQGHFETAAEQDAAVQKFLKVKPIEDVKWFKIADKTGVQLSLPTDFLETLEDTGEFSSDQLQAIGEAMTPLRSEKGFSKFARDASKVKGANPDVLRNYANWIEDNANFVSKLTYGRMMTASRAWTRSDMAELKAQGDIAGARRKQELLDTMTKAQDFILHPQEEWFQTRSVIALTYLMYAPKTALMNATGLFQTWAAMTADYGEISGNAIMAKATKDLISGKLTADEQWMKNKALEDGIIDQGFGYFMSGLANAGNLARRIRPTLIGRGARLFVDLGMWPFKAVETANRNLTMLAIYRAERTREMGHGKSLDEAKASAYNSASRKTRLLQNDYASGNRPEVLRGRKSLFMIFLSYPQYMLWIMSGGYERGTRAEARARGETPRSALGGMTVRMWLIFLALAGTEGVPFGESVLELLQRMWTLFGKGDNIRVEGQRFLKETAGIESMYWRNVIQRGFLHDVLGVDLSGSYSLGKPLPGLGLINPQSDNWRSFVGEAFEELAGPFGGVVKGGVGLGLSEDVGAKELGKSLPGAAGSIARAVGAAKNGVKSNQGERILRDEHGNLREPTAAEIAAIGAGFRLSQVADFQRLEALKRQQAEYWNGRRLGLKHSYKKALEDRDPQVREDVLKAVDEYNGEIPAQGLRLTFKELREYVKQDARKVRRLEQDRDPARVRGLNRDISEVMSAP